MSAFETSRLRGVLLHAGHAAEMFSLLQDPTIYLHIEDRPPASLEALASRYRFLQNGVSPDGLEKWLNWIMFLKDGGLPIGYFQATVRAGHASIAYVLNSRFRHHGLATEAGVAVIGRLFDTFSIEEVRAEIADGNAASIKVAKRLGLSFQAYNPDEREQVFSFAKRDFAARGSSSGGQPDA